MKQKFEIYTIQILVNNVKNKFLLDNSDISIKKTEIKSYENAEDLAIELIQHIKRLGLE